MDFWFAVTQIGLPEAWAALAVGMLFTYIMLRNTAWQRPSPQRSAFKAAAVLLALTLTLAFVSVHAVKTAAQVPRPCIPCGDALEPPACNPYCLDGDYSFPSGHAATIFSVCTVAMLIMRRRAAALLYLPACLVAWSRIVLGVHTIPDIAAGAFIGMVSAAIIWKIRPRIRILA